MPSSPDIDPESGSSNRACVVLTGRIDRTQELIQRYQKQLPRTLLRALPLLQIQELLKPADPTASQLFELIKNTDYLIGAAFSTAGAMALARLCELKARPADKPALANQKPDHPIDADKNKQPGAGELALVQARLQSMPWAAVGKRTGQLLEELLQLESLFCTSPDNTGAGLARALLHKLKSQHSSFPEPRILAIAAERGRPEFQAMMAAADITVHRFELYRTQTRQPRTEELASLPHKAWICFGSPSAVQAFFQAELPADQAFRWASIGPTTSQALQSMGQTVHHEASQADYGLLIEELDQRA